MNIRPDLRISFFSKISAINFHGAPYKDTFLGLKQRVFKRIIPDPDSLLLSIIIGIHFFTQNWFK